VAERDPLAEFLCDHLGMHVIDRTDSFTLVGADARRGKLTLFEADGEREPGVLGRVALRVQDLDSALDRLPADVAVTRISTVAAEFGAPERLGMGLVEADGDVEYDLDHVLLRVPDVEATAGALSGLGFEREGYRLIVDDKHVRLEQGPPLAVERPLLNHLALLVDSASDVEDEARRRGIEVADFVDAANTVAVFLWGAAGIKLEYVEHKPGFALA
jgi:catechol 2,3-dioxygenase-like lactoylglutathione lyase family enzyme